MARANQYIAYHQKYRCSIWTPSGGKIMGLRFRKSFKIAPGVRVNLNKKSASISVGTKGARITKSTSGRTTTTVGIPGTGISYSKSHTSKRKTSSTVNKASADTLPTDNKRKERVKYPPRKPVAYTPPTEKPMASDAAPAKKEHAKYPPRKPVAYTPPAKKPTAAESKTPVEPVDAMMAAYEKNPKGYKLSMKITRVFAPLICIMAAVLMLASPIVSTIVYLCGIWLSTLPRTFKEQQNNQPVTPFYKRKAVIAALVFLVIWLIVCMSVS